MAWIARKAKLPAAQVVWQRSCMLEEEPLRS